MRFCILLTAALVVATASPGFADDKKPDDRQWMVGKWKVVEATVDGEAVKDAPSFVVESKRFGGTEDSLFYNLPKELFPWNHQDVTDIAFDPKPEPEQVRISINVGGKRYDFPGIYNLDGDRLEMCLSRVRGKVPVEFASPKQSGLTHVIFERIQE